MGRSQAAPQPCSPEVNVYRPVLATPSRKEAGGQEMRRLFGETVGTKKLNLGKVVWRENKASSYHRLPEVPAPMAFWVL